MGLGTAVLLDKPGYLATAAHVVGMSDEGLFIASRCHEDLNAYQDGSNTSCKYWRTKIVATSPFHDLAILKADFDTHINLVIGGTDNALVGTAVSSFGYPHVGTGRMVLTQQNAEVGARIHLPSGASTAKYMVLNTLARPGQSGSPIFRRDNGLLVAILLGAYAPHSGVGATINGVDPATLHQTTHAISAEYLKGMY